jgi:glycosyltransferase involved in cell wall biosynthesis
VGFHYQFHSGVFSTMLIAAQLENNRNPMTLQCLRNLFFQLIVKYSLNLMKFLFIHQNFPAQFKHVAPTLAKRGHSVTVLAITPRDQPPGVTVRRYLPQRNSSPAIHPWVGDFESKVIRGEACFLAAQQLASSGYQPDLIVGHPGWGELLFIKELWPKTPQIHYLEFFYRSSGQDMGFDPEFAQPSAPARARLHIKNAHLLLSLNDMSAGISPTHWQASTLPAAYRDAVHVIHDGIDTDLAAPAAATPLRLQRDDGQWVLLSPNTPLVTFVARNLEPFRGYHQFMRALPAILSQSPHAQAVVVGGDGVSYGAAPPQGSWRDLFWHEVRAHLDPQRVHFVGRIPHATLLHVLRLSHAHVYLTYPFVLSWSMLEAMAVQAPIVGSDTAPVREVITQDQNGLLVDFFSPEAIAEATLACLSDPKRRQRLGQAARETIVSRYDLQRVCLPKHVALLEDWAAR